MRKCDQEIESAATPEAACAPVVALLERAPRVLAALTLVFTLIGHSELNSYRIAGTSMVPAFHDGDRIVVAAVPGFFGAPRVGEAVIARVGDEVVLKRIAGLPGDLIEAGDGQVLRNGEPSDDLIPAAFHDHCRFGPVRLGPDQYFLLGDHRSVSIDSREFGPVERGDLLGRVILRVPTRQSRGVAAAHARR